VTVCFVAIAIGVFALVCGVLERARTHAPWRDES
jgi:hypothetical protein